MSAKLSGESTREGRVDGALPYYVIRFITFYSEQRGALPSCKTGGGIRGGLGKVCA